MILDTRRTRRRATKEIQFKAAQRLLKRRDELSRIEREGIERRELDTPVFAGWERYFVVRHDIRRSPEGPYLDRILTLLQKVESCSEQGIVKERDYRRGGKVREVPHRLKSVDAGTYWAMTEKMRRHFELHSYRRRIHGTHKWRIETVFVVLRPWKFVTKVREKWLTHETVYTVNVDSEEAIIQSHLYGPTEWSYRHWARHVGDCFNKWDDYTVPPADLRRMPADDTAA